MAAAVVDRMKRHKWGADKMWQGLVMPDERLFEAGAYVIGDAPLWRSGDVPGEELPPEVAHLEEKVRALGREMWETSDARVAIYAELLATCAGCHRIARNPVP